MSLWSDKDREKASERRKRSINRRSQSPPREHEDPYLSSAGDPGTGYYRDEDCDDD